MKVKVLREHLTYRDRYYQWIVNTRKYECEQRQADFAGIQWSKIIKFNRLVALISCLQMGALAFERRMWKASSEMYVSLSDNIRPSERGFAFVNNVDFNFHYTHP